MNKKAKSASFFENWNQEIITQQEFFETEIKNKLAGTYYIRERDLPIIFTDIKVNSLKEIPHTLWIITELKGRYAALCSKQELAREYPNQISFSIYDIDMQMSVIGAIHAETKTLLNLVGNNEEHNAKLPRVLLEIKSNS